MTPSAVSVPALMFCGWAEVRSIEASGICVAQHGSDRRRAAAVGDVDEVGAGHRLEQLHREMLARIRRRWCRSSTRPGLAFDFSMTSLTVFGPVLGLATMHDRDVDQLGDRRELV